MPKSKKLKLPNSDKATQSNHLIEASYKLSIAAKRVFLMLLGEVHPAMKSPPTNKFRIYAKDYEEKSGMKGKRAYDDIKNGAKELQKSTIIIRNEIDRTTEHISFLDYVKYHDNEGWLEASFPIWIWPHITKLVAIGYTTIETREALRFSRFYSIRLYELMMQFQRKNERYILLSDLKKVFQVENHQYKRFIDFKRRIIEPSIKEIESKTDWVIDWEPIKTGRKVTSISFIFEKQKQRELFK
jgi:plasmid replication initiation protein